MVTTIITIDKITTYPTDKQKNQFLKQKFACEQDALIILADMSVTTKTSISSDGKIRIVALLCAKKISNLRNKKNLGISSTFL